MTDRTAYVVELVEWEGEEPNRQAKSVRVVRVYAHCQSAIRKWAEVVWPGFKIHNLQERSNDLILEGWCPDDE